MMRIISSPFFICIEARILCYHFEWEIYRERGKTVHICVKSSSMFVLEGRKLKMFMTNFCLWVSIQGRYPGIVIIDQFQCNARCVLLNDNVSQIQVAMCYMCLFHLIDHLEPCIA